MSAAAYRRWGVALAVAGTLVFSFRPILVKLIYITYPASAVTVLFLRMAISLPFFLVVAWWLRHDEPRLTRRDWAALIALGFIGYYAASFLDMLGLKYVGAGVGRLILYLYPTLVLLISFVFLHRKPTPRQLGALVMTYAGVTLILASQAHGGAEGRLFVLGAMLVFGSSLFYATYLVASAELVKRVGSMRFTAYSMAVATLPAVVQFFALEPLSALDLPGRIWFYAFLLGTFCTVLPLFIQAEALKRIGATEFALIGALGPLSVAVTSALGLDEHFTLFQAFGGALIILGVLLVSLKRN
ncbi:MAG: DMT family transporter [Betaproteobacteria bacterium]|nr:DMT family transporter [Betaproteobacteria bacterium]